METEDSSATPVEFIEAETDTTDPECFGRNTARSEIFMSGSDRSMSLNLTPTGQRALLIDAARLSRMAYASPKTVQTLYQQVKAGKYGTDIETETVLKRVTEPPVYLDDPTSDAQGYGVKYDGPQGPMTIVAYRGTSSLADAFADSEIRLVPLETKKLPAQRGCCVHDGFLGQFKALEQQTDDFLQGVYGGLVTGSPATPKTQSHDSAKDVGEVVHEVIEEPAESLKEPAEGLKEEAEGVKEQAESVKDQTVEAVQDIADDPAKKSEDLRQTVVKAIQDLVNETAEVGKDVKETIVEAVQVAANDTSKGGEELKETVKDVVQKIEQGDLSTKDGAGIVANAVVDKSSGVVSDVGGVVGGGTDSDAVYESFMGGPPLVFVGHSLGSALSSIGALVYSLRYDSKGTSWSGFGCPRTGNKAWASLFNSRVAQGSRVKLGSDPIDSIIPPIIYRHVGNTYVHIGQPDMLPDVSLMAFIPDHDIAKYVVDIQKADTSEIPNDWLRYVIGFLINTPVHLVNLFKSLLH